MADTENKTKKGDKDDKEVDDRTLRQKIMSEVKFFAGLAVFLLVFWTTIFGHYKIPSESMQPTLEVGDHLYVSKFAYGYSRHSLPLGLHKLPFLPERGKIFSRLPKRGDVVVFRNPITKIVMIKRAVGLPGDKVAVKAGRLYVNGEMVEREIIDQLKYREHKKNKKSKKVPDINDVTVYEEQFEGEKKPHIIYEEYDNPGYGVANSYDETTVPPDTIFFMGDNRDNSRDSRFLAHESLKSDSGPGFVPLDHLIGRADLIMFSFKRCKKEPGLYCPKRRYLSPIR
ncbi:MAG: signal peptidase I [Hellea sp.]|nr:signal peptidase I [Hellea sp.]